MACSPRSRSSVMRSATAFDDAFAAVVCMPCPSCSIAIGDAVVLALPIVVPKPATSAAARARIASMAIVCRLFLIKEPPTSRLSEAIRRDLDTGSTVRSIRAADPRRRRARPGHDRRPAGADAAPLEPDDRGPAQVRALSADRLLQGPRRAEQDQ